MTGAHVLANAHDIAISGSTFYTANTIHINNGNRTTFDGVIPLIPNPSTRFTGRTEIITKLKRHFFTNTTDSAPNRKFFLLHGMGGIGKTQICLKFLEEMYESFSQIFWVDASSSGTILQALKGISQSCALDGSPASALQWIGSLKENYIMIFDSADVLSHAALEGYFPPGKKGNILITSRNSAMKILTSPENSLEVTEMDERDAIVLLLKASGLESPSLDVQVEASRIVKELFCFPLAIDQAGAYIASGATTIGAYLAKYSEHRKTLLSHPEFTGPSKYNRAVYETWELSYKEIQQRTEAGDSHKASAANSAMLLLELFPFFHHEEITEEIFYYAALQKDQASPKSDYKN